MKQIKKLASLLLALAMVFALSCTAFAEGETYTITVSNAVKDTTYSAYKIFDATYSGNAVSYTIPTGSTIAQASGFSDVFTTTTNGDKTYVTVKSGVADQQVVSWLKAYTVSGTPAATQKNTDGATTVTLNVGAPGYYYVGSTPDGEGTSAAVSLTTVAPTATVVDKNSTKPNIDSDDGKKVATSAVGTYSSVATMDVGDTAYFKITYNATNYVVADGVSTQITSYTITDTPDGFSIDKDSVAVKVGTTTLESTAYTVSVDETTGVLTINIPWVNNNNESIYTSPSDVEITYTATLTNKNAAGASKNSATIKYNNTEIPEVPDTEVYNYKIVIDKYDSADTTKAAKLAGAEFVLKNSENKFYKVDAQTGAVSWVTDQANATVVTTDTNGAANFTGLKAGTYTLVETKAPAGYNLGANTTITLNAVTTKLENTSSLTVTSQVANSAGSTLPTTGGMGTTIFYIAGAILVLGAGVVLVTRRRMNGAK